MATKTKQRSLARGGNLLEGSPLAKGDFLLSRRTGVVSRVVTQPRKGLVKLESTETGKTRVSTLTSVGKNYARA